MSIEFHESMRLQGHEPANTDEAQYALAFPLAALAVRGKVGAEEVTGDAIFAEDILSLSRKITLIDAPNLSARFPNEILSRLRVYLKDGSVVESPVTAAGGDPGKPMSAEEFNAKYYALARAGLSEARTRAIAATVAALPDVDSCTALLNAVLETPG